MSDSGDKTEEATPKKLRDARKRGQVPKSKDLPSAFILIFGAAYFWSTWDSMSEILNELFLSMGELLFVDFKLALFAALELIVDKVIWGIALPFAFVAVIAGILGNIVQFGFIFSIDPVLPKMSKVNPGEGIKRIFSMKQMMETLLSLVKTIVIGVVMLYVIYTGIESLMNEASQCNVECQKAIIESLLAQMFMFIIPIVFVLAILDFIYQRIQFMKEQRMTKEEIKREFKEMFGDPHVEGERRNLRRELAEDDIKDKIKTARLIVIDIGVSIALHFVQDETPLPIITAMGKDQMAKKMLEIAQIEDVPTIVDPGLAQLLLEDGKIDQYIPESSIEKVATAMRKTPKG